MLQELANIKDEDIYIRDIRFTNHPNKHHLPSLLIIAPITNTSSKTIQIDFDIRPFEDLGYEALGLSSEYEYEYTAIKSWLEKAEDLIKSFGEQYYCFPFHLHSKWFENYIIPVNHLGILPYNARLYFEHCLGSGEFLYEIAFTHQFYFEKDLFVNSYSKRIEALDRLFLVDPDLIKIAEDLRGLSLRNEPYFPYNLGWPPGEIPLDTMSMLIQRIESISLIFNTPNLVDHVIFNRVEDIQKDVTNIMSTWYKDYTEPPFLQ